MKLVLAKIFFFTKRETHANSSTFCSTNMVNQKTHTKPHGEQMFFSSSYIHVTAYCGFVDFLLFSCIPTKMDKPWSGRKKSICIKLKLPTLLPQLNVLLCLTLQHIANRMEYGRCGALRRLIHFHSFYVQFSCMYLLAFHLLVWPLVWWATSENWATHGTQFVCVPQAAS